MPFDMMQARWYWLDDYEYKTQIHVIVNNTHANKQIYDGEIKDMVGIKCDLTHCEPWE
ncbi:hypothetical protein [Parashewanella curva]|uniref:hypothetical protein n=1 Tax=Parashewanella curva TaxID=2338552 RepID=UPI001404E848|nr:hypothetical protein [Parashewanella curva]